MTTKPPKTAAKPAAEKPKAAAAQPGVSPDMRLTMLQGTLNETRQQLADANASTAEARTAAKLNGEIAKAEKARADKAEAELAKLKGDK